MGWLLVAALALVLVAGWSARAETALLRVSRAGAKELGRSPGEGPAPLQAVLAEVSRYLAVLVLVRVASEVAATVLVTAVLVQWIGSDWRPYLASVAIMVVVAYAIAAIVPRSRGQERTVKVATTAAVIMRPIVRLLGPFPRLLLATSGAFRRGTESGDGPSGSEEDLRGLVDLLEQRQIIQPDERAMIHSVFELGDTIVREVMVPRTDMVFVERDKTLRQALSLALRSGFSRIPVVGENLDDVVGIAYLKDIVTRSYEYREGESVETVDSVMRLATFVPESKPIDELLREMQARQTHVAIVIDEYGGTAGLATIEDILEEIVGEIADEYDREEPPVEWLSDGQARVTARLSVEELEELFDVSIEAEDVETAGGLLAQRLGRVPIPGATVTVAGLRLTAESLAGRRNRIGSVRISRISEDAEVSGGPPGRDRDGAAAGWAAANGDPAAGSSGSDSGASAGAARAGAARAGEARAGTARAGEADAARSAVSGPGTGQAAPRGTSAGQSPAEAEVAATGEVPAGPDSRASRKPSAGSAMADSSGSTGTDADEPGTSAPGAGGSGVGASGASEAAAGTPSGSGPAEADESAGAGGVNESSGAGGADAAGRSGNGQVSAGRPRQH